MKISELLKELYKQSDFTSVGSLAEELGLQKSLIDRVFAGKNTTENIDKLSSELLKDITTEELLLAIEMIRKIKTELKNQDQFI